MTNLEFLQRQPIHKIAEKFIQVETKQDNIWHADKAYNIYRTSDNQIFEDYDEAIGYEIQWLLSERL